MPHLNQSLDYIGGCNSPASFVSYGDKTFIPADHGIVLVEAGKQRHWMPISPGKYPIDQLAVSSSGVLCVSEQRLQVRLHFFDATTLQQIGSVETGIRVGVSSMVFSAKADQLYVLSTVPSASVNVFRCIAGKREYVASGEIDLPPGAVPLSLIPIDSAETTAKVVVRYSDEIRGFSQVPNKSVYSVCFKLTADAADACAFSSASLHYITSNGALCTYAYSDRAKKEICVLPISSKATALAITESIACVGTSTGELFTVNLIDGAVLHVSRLPRASLIYCVKAALPGRVFIGSAHGLFTAVVASAQDIESQVQLVKGWRPAPSLKCLSTRGGADAIWVLRDGTFLVHDNGCVTESLAGVCQATAIDACTLDASHILILYDDACLRCFSIRTGNETWRHECLECVPKFVESNGNGRAACCGADTVRFLRCTGERIEDRGIVHATLLASITLARWLPDEASLLAVCENGDVFLVEQPTEGDAATSHAAETLVRNSWRLEFPITDALICHTTPDAINMFANSADRDAKVYALDRRYEGETKVSRPLFLLNDHVSGGSRLVRLSSSTVLSCGRDGRLVARDLSPYQVVLPPTPPSREKRKPLWVCTARSSFRSGIASAAVVGNGSKLICCGNDTVIHCYSLRSESRSGSDGSKVAWDEPRWQVQGGAGLAADGGAFAAGAEKRASDPQRESLRTALERVREVWAKAMREKDDEVPLEALMTEEQRAAFTVECENAVHEMQERQYYHSLLNDYLQDTIRQRCCNAMEVPRMKVVSMNAKDLVVHNFHLHRTTCKDASLSRKALFMRQLQKRIKDVHRTSINSQPPPPQSGTATNEKNRTVSDYGAAMLNEADLYTQSRLVVQSLLVRGRELAAKEDFNVQFGNLQESKRNLAAQMEERTQRCVAIGKQLGALPAPLYKPLVDPEEDPEALFRVDNNELSVEAQALIVPSESVAVVSAVNEAAVHLWMDGLDKEVERLEVDVPVPDFADDSRDTFVPPEERTEEQLRALEAYTKKLKEEQDRVDAKRDALRSEFKALQSKNHEAAAKLDEQLKGAQQSRLSAVEEVDEAELRLALLFEHRLCTLASHRQYRLCAPQVEVLREELVEAKSWLVQLKSAFDAAQSRCTGSMEQVRRYVASSGTTYPFSDGAAGEKLHRRFARWQRRFEEGKAPLPDAGTPLPECDAEHWSAFCAHCEEVERLQGFVHEAEHAAQQAADEVDVTQQRCTSIEERIEALGKEAEAVRDRSVVKSLDTPILCRLHQGQIQDEAATTCTAFSAFNLRWRSDVTQYNELILASDAESRALLQRIIQRRKLMKRLDWEKDKLEFDAGTQQMKLRHLHTLRVTRQMQEYINGDAGVSEEQRLAAIQRHMQLVEANMNRKVEDLRTVAQRLRKQISDRVTENVFVEHQVGEVSGTVRDSAAVYHLLDTHADGTSAYMARSKEIFETSELEELARTQQEELVRLKREVDRLRERTFPSFAVVSKQTR